MKIGNHFDMQIRRLKTENFAWESWFSDSALLNCVEWPGFQLLLPNASNNHIIQKSHCSKMCLDRNRYPDVIANEPLDFIDGDLVNEVIN